MRFTDLVLALPALLVAIVLLGVFGGGYAVAVAVLVLFMAPYDIRIIRGATLEQRGLPYVDAARTTGLGQWQIMLRHIWPNSCPSSSRTRSSTSPTAWCRCRRSRSSGWAWRRERPTGGAC